MTRRVTGTLSADGSTGVIVTTGRPLWFAGNGSFGAPAGTLTLEFQLEDGTWFAIDAGIVGTLAAAGQLHVPDFPPDLNVRGTLAGATAPSLAFVLQG